MATTLQQCVKITDGNNSVKINSVTNSVNQTNRCFHHYNAVTVTDNKMRHVTLMRIMATQVTVVQK